jgi:RNA polymerase sigma factor (sigma-70 family)
MTSDDMALVREYAQSNSEQAFATLVSRHVNLVYSVAQRQVHDPSLAEEITQAVFIILARKAKSLSPKTILSGWLCRTVRYVSGRALRTERRRQFREREAQMQSTLNEADSNAWQHIAPLLDEALNCLGQKEHDAVVLRFFDGKELKQVGEAMGTGEDAARMRVNRGLEKLQEFFTKRGVTLSATAIAGAVAANSVQAAPAGLAGSVAGAALASAAAGTITTLSILKSMTLAKVTLGIAGVILAGLLAALLFHERQHSLGMGYTIRGTLTYEGHGLGESPYHLVVPFKRDFEVGVKDGKWVVKMTLIGNTNFKYFVSTFDGTNIVYVGKSTDEDLARLRASIRDKPRALAGPEVFQSCTVEQAPVPMAVSSAAGAHAWLALASGCYFKGVTGTTALDIHPLDAPQAGHFVRRELPCKFQLSTEAPYLPLQVQYAWTNILLMFPNGRLVDRPLPATFKGSFLAMELKSEQFTNVGGMSFPTKFEIREYMPLPTATNESDFRCTLVVRGLVTAISTTEQQFTNELAGEVFHVRDLRLPNAPGYHVTNGVIPSPDSPSLAEAKRQAAFRASLLRGSGTGNSLLEE